MKLVRFIRKIVPRPILVLRRNLMRKIACYKMKRGTIYHLGVLLTTNCNLNCRHCADLIPYRKQKNYDKDKVIDDLDKILRSIKCIEEVLLIGGEVFLYKDLKYIVQYCINNKKIKRVILTTNGSIIPNEEMFNLLQSKKVLVRVSGYPDYVAPNRSKLIDAIKYKKIRLEDLSCQQWKDIGINYNYNRSPKELEELFIGCPMKDCLCINEDGLVFWCSREIAAYYTKDYPSPHISEYINVRESSVGELQKKWLDFINMKYISTCNYCNGINDDSKSVGTGLQIIPKKDFVLLLSVYLKAQQNKINKDDCNLVLQVLDKYRNSLVDIRFINELIDYLNEYDYTFAYDLLKRLLQALSVDYRLLNYNSEKTVDCFKNRNVIMVYYYNDNCFVNGDYNIDITIPISKINMINDIFIWNTY